MRSVANKRKVRSQHLSTAAAAAATNAAMLCSRGSGVVVAGVEGVAVGGAVQRGWFAANMRTAKAHNPPDVSVAEGAAEG